MPGPKRLVPLGSRRSPNFRYLSLRSNKQVQSTGRRWASCQTWEKARFPREIPVPILTGGVYVSSRTVGIILAAFATFAFAPLSASGVVLGYAGAGTGAPFAITSTGTLGNIGLFFTGLGSALGFASQYIRTPTFANFNKPCSEEQEQRKQDQGAAF